YKARFSIYGGKQVYGMNYCKTYTPVVTRYAICLIITFSILFRLSLCQVDFVLTYTQAPDHILKLLANLMTRSKQAEYGTNT
ncbi:hypothetical protein ACHAXS_007674, partial [Conticribra weissflogii]